MKKGFQVCLCFKLSKVPMEIRYPRSLALGKWDFGFSQLCKTSKHIHLKVFSSIIPPPVSKLQMTPGQSLAQEIWKFIFLFWMVSKRAADIIFFSVTPFTSSSILFCSVPGVLAWVSFCEVLPLLYSKIIFLTWRYQDFSQCIYLTLDSISAGLLKCYQCFQLLLHDHQIGREVGRRRG